MKMRAKLTVTGIIKEKNVEGERIQFEAKYDANNSPEDNSYSKYTPSASMSMYITNPNLVGSFTLGQQFYVDFTEIA